MYMQYNILSVCRHPSQSAPLFCSGRHRHTQIQLLWMTLYCLLGTKQSSPNWTASTRFLYRFYTKTSCNSLTSLVTSIWHTHTTCSFLWWPPILRKYIYHIRKNKYWVSTQGGGTTPGKACAHARTDMVLLVVRKGVCILTEEQFLPPPLAAGFPLWGHKACKHP